MDNVYDKVVKLTAEILKKSWNPEPGKVTPFSSSSSMHSETSDNHLEYYVQQDSKKPLENAIAEIFNSNFWTNGGDKMTEKTLDVDSSTTPKQQYNNPGASTTEPDPQSNIAITKSDRPKDSSDVEGKGTYSTTANTTESAPKSGDTTEPTAKAADACPDCGKSMTMCNCAGMSKAEDGKDAEPDADDDDAAKKAKQLKKAKKLIKKYKKAKKLVKAAKADKKSKKEMKDSEKQEEPMQKMADSTWKGAFSPNIKRGM